MCFMTCDALPLGLLTCHPCDCCIHTPIACSPYIYIPAPIVGHEAEGIIKRNLIARNLY